MQSEILQLLKTKPNKWWFADEVKNQLGHKPKCGYRWNKLIKFGFIDRKVTFRNRPGRHFQYKIKRSI